MTNPFYVGYPANRGYAVTFHGADYVPYRADEGSIGSITLAQAGAENLSFTDTH